MSRRRPGRRLGALGAVAAAAGLVVAAAGCDVKQPSTSLSNGKQLFVAKCGVCHVLNRAGTKGTTGPDLDQAFARSLRDGFHRDTIRGVVVEQIANPNNKGAMPADLVKGQDAQDVAAYVAKVADARGKDTGILASIGQQKAKGNAVAKNGVLEIDAASAGLAYVDATATAPAGKVTIKSKNPQPIGHDIAIQGNGVNAKGAVVQGGGVSQFSATLKPGKYTFYCTVPGHREGGMVGTLTVK
jgi:mono/diheme cytochrome c family protein